VTILSAGCERVISDHTPARFPQRENDWSGFGGVWTGGFCLGPIFQWRTLRRRWEEDLSRSRVQEVFDCWSFDEFAQ
jgi:hypothetical protein